MYKDSSIYECMHCSNRLTSKKKYCSQCATADGRREQDEANEIFWQEKFGKPYICKICKTEKDIRQRKKDMDKKYDEPKEEVVKTSDSSS